MTRGLFSKKEPPPLVLPDRADLREALRHLGADGDREFRQGKPSREIFPEAIRSPRLADTSILAVIYGYIGTGTSLLDKGIFFLTPDHLFDFKKSIAEPVDPPSLAVPLKEIYDYQEGDRTFELWYGHRHGYLFNIANAEDHARQYFKDQLRDAIDAAQAKKASSAVSPATSEADELEKFAALRDRGVITDEEFQAKKADILGM